MYNLEGLKSKPQQNYTCKLWQWCYTIVSSLMEPLIGDEKYSLPLCVYVVGFGKSSDIKFML